MPYQYQETLQIDDTTNEWFCSYVNNERHPPHTFNIRFGSEGVDLDEAQAYADAILRRLNE